jgi:hypothetical protein
MKYEWKKEEKDLYLPQSKPTIIKVPKMNFFVIDGEGDPNTSEEFSDAIGALYSLSYGVRMMPKSGTTPKGYFEYTVYPLEGVWDMKVDENTDFVKLNKSKFIYSLMIRQPDFVDKKLASDILEKVRNKKPNKLLDKVRFESIEDGLCVQMMHIGSYDDEPKSFNEMLKYCEENGYVRKCHNHREIYLSDFRKVDKDKLKTVVRFWIEKK